MSDFASARTALERAVLRVFPNAKPSKKWAGIDAWAAPRPEGAIVHASTGTYDPKVIVIGIADRKAGPTIYFLDPGDYHALDTHRKLLEDGGLTTGRGCIYHARKAPLPVGALEKLFRAVKARDAKAAKAKPAPVDEYLARLPPAQRRALERLRKQIRAAAPEATEKMSYGMPTFAHEGNLVHMAAFKDHCSFFPGSGGVTTALKSDLKGYKTAKGTIQFTPDKPIPAALVKKIVKMRVAENEAEAAARLTRSRRGSSRRGKPPTP